MRPPALVAWVSQQPWELGPRAPQLRVRGCAGGFWEWREKPCHLKPQTKDLKEYLWSGLSLVPRQGDVPKGHLSHHQSPCHRDPTSCHSHQPQHGPVGPGLPLGTSCPPPRCWSPQPQLEHCSARCLCFRRQRPLAQPRGWESKSSTQFSDPLFLVPPYHLRGGVSKNGLYLRPSRSYDVGWGTGRVDDSHGGLSFIALFWAHVPIGPSPLPALPPSRERNPAPERPDNTPRTAVRKQPSSRRGSALNPDLCALPRVRLPMHSPL